MVHASWLCCRGSLAMKGGEAPQSSFRSDLPALSARPGACRLAARVVTMERTCRKAPAQTSDALSNGLQLQQVCLNLSLTLCSR